MYVLAYETSKTKREMKHHKVRNKTKQTWLTFIHKNISPSVCAKVALSSNKMQNKRYFYISKQNKEMKNKNKVTYRPANLRQSSFLVESKPYLCGI